MKEKVDIVIPTYKPEKNLTELIQRLARQNCEINKIIIINTYIEGFSFPKLGENVKEKLEYHDIKPEEFNHGLTRNYGMALSDAEYVVFMTQDALPADDRLVEELLKPFEDEDVYVTYARQLPKKDCKYVERYIRTFNYPDNDMVKTKEDFEKIGIKTIFCSDVCAAYRRDKHMELGGFPKTDFNEDMIYAYKTVMAGKKVYYASKARVIHSHNYSYMQQFKRNAALGKSQKEFDNIFGKIKSEDEGIKMIKNVSEHLIRSGKWYLIPDLILSSGFKFLGYKTGKRNS